MTPKVSNGEQTRRQRVLRSLEDIANAGLIGSQDLPSLQEVAAHYAVAITPAVLSTVDRENPRDPVALQYVPSIRELETTSEELDDPISDDPNTPVPGITHRYPDRLLLKPLHACRVYCRFCFRREVVGPGEGLLKDHELDLALDYIRSHGEVWEVILSGGDPLILSAARLKRIFSELDQIPHVEVVRIHTRVPVADPGLINEPLLDAIDIEKPVYVVLHCNHANELNADAEAALRRLNRRGFPLLSQSVLLKGVNDTPDELEALLRSLVRNRVKPYYLHQGDLARGTSHFRTSIEHGQSLMKQLRGSVSGICQPTYVLDIPGGHGKVPIGPNYAIPSSDAWIIEDIHGTSHQYPPVPSDKQHSG